MVKNSSLDTGPPPPSELRAFAKTLESRSLNATTNTKEKYEQRFAKAIPARSFDAERLAQLLDIAQSPGSSEDNKEVALADIWREFRIH